MVSVGQKLPRFAAQWLFFGIYVLFFARLFIILEDESQQFRKNDRDYNWYVV